MPLILFPVKPFLHYSASHFLHFWCRYCWPSIIVYAPKYLQSNWVVSTTMLSNIFWHPIMTGIMVRLGPVRSVQVGSQISAGSVLIAGVLAEMGCALPVFMLWYVFIFSMGMTMSYTSTLPPGWAWFPCNRGMVSGKAPPPARPPTHRILSCTGTRGQAPISASDMCVPCVG